jgi:hypothetical protein
MSADKLQSWFQSGASFKKLFMSLPGLILLLAACTYGGFYLGQRFYSTASLTAHARAIGTQLARMSDGMVLLNAAGIAPLWEETVFRLVPFCLLFAFLWLFKLKNTRIGLWAVIIGIGVTSLIFGLVHGPHNYFIQGPIGVILAVVYVKWSSFGGGILAALKGWFASMLVHGSYNAVLMTLYLIHR